jgi:hypothetical protein
VSSIRLGESECASFESKKYGGVSGSSEGFTGNGAEENTEGDLVKERVGEVDV